VFDYAEGKSLAQIMGDMAGKPMTETTAGRIIKSIL